MMTFNNYVAKNGLPKAGQKVYIMTYNWGRYSSSLVTIKSVSPTGRKIVTVRENGHEDIFNGGDHQNKYSKAFLDFDFEGRAKQIENDNLKKEAVKVVNRISADLADARYARDTWSKKSMFEYLQDIRKNLEEAEAAVANLPDEE